MLDSEVLKEAAGVLALANTLATEYYSGVPLRDLEPRRQKELVAEAKDRIERYKEQ